MFIFYCHKTNCHKFGVLKQCYLSPVISVSHKSRHRITGSSAQWFHKLNQGADWSRFLLGGFGGRIR